MDKINLKAPAKINLFLKVLDRRPDGYHNIDSLMQTVDLYDELTIERSDEIELICDDLPELRADENLAFRAAEMIAGMAYYPGARITLKKRIPAGSGLGGGSSDAAFVIRGLIKLFDLRLNPDDIIARAVDLGADIPFFLGRGQARVGGKGEIIQDCKIPLKYKVLIVKPHFSIDTARAYREIDRIRKGEFYLTNPEKFTFLYRNIADHKFVRIAHTFINELEEVVFAWHPELSQVRQRLLDDGAFYAGMSGSGSAIVGLFSPDNTVDKTARRFSGKQYSVFVCRPVVLPPAN